MIVLAGGDIVAPDRVIPGSLVIDADRIVAVESRTTVDLAGATRLNVRGQTIVPGFVDVHLHGLEGHDTLGETGALAAIASRLPRYGVTAFCPTTVACTPVDLRRVLEGVRGARTSVSRDSARVLPAHLESNFINPEYRGAQPAVCLRVPSGGAAEGEFTGREILEVVELFRADVGVITLAPELPGGLGLVEKLVAAGHRVSLGHSAATFDEAMAAIDAGATRATHLFNRMPPLGHRAPGLAGAVLSRDDVAAELICDGYHVHPAMCRMAVATKGVDRVMAITDATAGAGLPVGTIARLGTHEIRVEPHAAFLRDGTLAGSTLTMDAAFRRIVTQLGLSLPDAVALCSSTPARQLGMTGFGAIAEGMVADIVVLDAQLRVARTFIAGHQVYERAA